MNIHLLERVLQREFVDPATLFGAIFYTAIFLWPAWLAAHALRATVRQVLERDERGHIDRTTAAFLTELAQIGIYVLALMFYAHLIPTLRSLGTALLTSVGVASVVIGLAAQNTLSNLVAGISLILYRPFHVGDRVQVTAPPTGRIQDGTPADPHRLQYN